MRAEFDGKCRDNILNEQVRAQRGQVELNKEEKGQLEGMNRQRIEQKKGQWKRNGRDAKLRLIDHRYYFGMLHRNAARQKESFDSGRRFWFDG